MFERLKNRWNLKSGTSLFLVLLVFALTGTTIVLIKPYIISWWFGSTQPPVWFTVMYYILILPIYNIVLLIYGAIFGQFNFFWNFEKKMFKRFQKKKEDA